jgi:hypothetical protein
LSCSKSLKSISSAISTFVNMVYYFGNEIVARKPLFGSASKVTFPSKAWFSTFWRPFLKLNFYRNLSHCLSSLFYDVLTKSKPITTKLAWLYFFIFTINSCNTLYCNLFGCNSEPIDWFTFF